MSLGSSSLFWGLVPVPGSGLSLMEPLAGQERWALLSPSCRASPWLRCTCVPPLAVLWHLGKLRLQDTMLAVHPCTLLSCLALSSWGSTPCVSWGFCHTCALVFSSVRVIPVVSLPVLSPLSTCVHSLCGHHRGSPSSVQKPHPPSPPAGSPPASPPGVQGHTLTFPLPYPQVALSPHWLRGQAHRWVPASPYGCPRPPHPSQAGPSHPCLPRAFLWRVRVLTPMLPLGRPAETLPSRVATPRVGPATPMSAGTE